MKYFLKRVNILVLAGIIFSSLFASMEVYATQSSTSQNSTSNAGGRLHNHFEHVLSWEVGQSANLDVFVENFMVEEYQRNADGSYALDLENNRIVFREAGEPIFVRVRMYEILELDSANGTGQVVTVPANANMEDVSTWAPRIPENEVDGDSAFFRTHFSWAQNQDGDNLNQIWYVPTFNRNPDSHETDVRGASFDPRGALVPNTNSTNIRYGTGMAFPLEAGGILGNEWAEDGDVVHTSFLYLDHATFHTREQRARQTINPKETIWMEDWLLLEREEKIGPFWVLDTDGWAYWAQALQPGTSTGVLLDEITYNGFAAINSLEVDSWQYYIFVNSQMATAWYWEKTFAENLGGDGRDPITEQAVYLMETITRPVTGILELESVYMFTSSRLPGLYADGTPSEDMGFNDYSLERLLEISPILHQQALLYGDTITRATVFSDARNLAIVSTLTLPFFQPHANRPIVQSMFDHFFAGSGEKFRNTRLTEVVFEHNSTLSFVSLVESEIHSYLQANGGDPRGIDVDMARWRRLEQRRPVFNTAEDRHNGLVIMIHDTWGRSVEIRDFRFDGTDYSGMMRIIIWDHFGLDTGDVLAERTPLEQLMAPTSFHSWYVLQHYRGTQERYRPMVSWFETDIPFYGSLL